MGKRTSTCRISLSVAFANFYFIVIRRNHLATAEKFTIESASRRCSRRPPIVSDNTTVNRRNSSRRNSTSFEWRQSSSSPTFRFAKSVSIFDFEISSFFLHRKSSTRANNNKLLQNIFNETQREKFNCRENFRLLKARQPNNLQLRCSMSSYY